jgi:FAD/FMN-containing dehydrogenase
MRISRKVLPASTGTESVIQDVAIPIEEAAAFLEFLLSEIRITPVWLCPFRASPDGMVCPLYPIRPGALYINFGFWDVIPSRNEPGYYNRMVERVAQALHGRKALYSSSFYDAETFGCLYDRKEYKQVKNRCDPAGVFGDLYAKCVGGK